MAKILGYKLRAMPHSAELQLPAMQHSEKSELCAMRRCAELQHICNMKPNLVPDPVPDPVLHPVPHTPPDPVLVPDPKPDQLVPVPSFNLSKSESGHWSKPESDSDLKPQITDPARNFGYLQILKLFQA
jgi:hypothetical protein